MMIMVDFAMTKHLAPPQAHAYFPLLQVQFLILATLGYSDSIREL